jgi:hypothetical protein
MTKAKYPSNIKTTHTLTKNLKDFSATFDSWANARQSSIQAQYQLLQSCKNDQEVQYYKDKGFFKFESFNI